MTFPVTWREPSDAELTWERDPMHCPNPLSPLSADYMAGVVAGMNHRFERYEISVRVVIGIFNGYFYTADRFEGDRATIIERSRASRREISRTLRPFWDETVMPALRETYASLERAPVETAPLDAVAALWDEAWRRQRAAYALHFLITAGSYQALDDLADLYESLFPDAPASEALALVQGQPSDLQRVQRDLHLLAEAARANPAVADAIVRGPSLAALRTANGGQHFLDALQRFLDAHGHLGQPFDELEYPSWADEPELVLDEVRKRLVHAYDDAEETRQRLAAGADAVAERARARLRDRPDDLARFEAALAHARDVGPLTESHNYWLDRMLQARMHRFVLRVGQRLVDARVLDAPEDVYYLHVEEVGAALREPRDLRALASERRGEHERWRALDAPPYLGAPPETDGPPNRFWTPADAGAAAGALRGAGASAGVARGPARVVRGPEDFARVRPGDVLVCPSSNPSWVPLFAVVAGLVTDTGGVLSHAAVVAREFGVPAVVGTNEATTRLRDGQMVEVDGTAGEVRLV